jgi:restriction endonuclease Mrr
MTIFLEKEKEKAPSKKLKEKIHACISSFQKLGAAVNEALEQGRKEGFTDREIGKMIRDEMLQAGFERSTIAGYLPSSAKQRPRGKPGSHNKISGKNPQTGAVENPRLEEEQIQESDILAKDDFDEQKRIDEEENRPVPVPVPDSRADVQRVAPLESVIRLQSAYVELDPEGDEYDIEHLEKYSRSILVRIIKWQHKHIQEGYNEGTSWKSKYMSLKAKYKRATGKDWVD